MCVLCLGVMCLGLSFGLVVFCCILYLSGRILFLRIIQLFGVLYFGVGIGRVFFVYCRYSSIEGVFCVCMSYGFLGIV